MTELELAELRPLVEMMASERAQSGTALHEDAVQEGLIAAWRASESHPGKKPAYYRAAARNGVKGVMRGRPMTGEPRRQGREDAHDSSEPLVRTAESGQEYLAVEPAIDPMRQAIGNAAVEDALKGMGRDEELLSRLLIEGYQQHEVAALAGWSEHKATAVRKSARRQVAAMAGELRCPA